ncbi:MFS transporter [Sphaerisporangium sp. TRM90804]|uniref:MFS transporter n=1 Tax=Sphaerisporangium sp. TRM90804 TaxID=3031113 RepID=UPI002448463D|nr:MFS transporter [Sphaerisporangium sp. TRM90804]MDH2428163.1 MFS transporter [Sphaerisporangium sp. TRM90804]
MFWLPWAAMVAIAPLQYGYAAAAPALMGVHGGTPLATLAPLALWIVCQGLASIPAVGLVRRGRLSVRAALWTGAALSGAALLTLAVSAHPAVLLAGYAVLGGVGAGLVYGVCAEAVARWYPERPGTRVSFVTGAFAYGAAPLAVVAGLSPGLLQPAFAVAAVVALAVVGTAAGFVRLPPAHWWPARIDPRTHALDRLILRRTPPAVRQFSTGQALRTGALAGMAAILVCAGAVSVFDVVALATLGGTAPWAALALLVVLNGAGRACAMLASEVFGRRRVLSTTLALLAVGQLLLAAGASTRSPGLLVAAGAVAGLGGGAFYPLIAGLVREYFGEERTSEIHGVVYSTKAVAGVLGVGLAIAAMTASSHAGSFLVMALLALLSAAVSHALRVPGRPVTLPV